MPVKPVNQLSLLAATGQDTDDAVKGHPQSYLSALQSSHPHPAGASLGCNGCRLRCPVRLFGSPVTRPIRRPLGPSVLQHIHNDHLAPTWETRDKDRRRSISPCRVVSRQGEDDLKSSCATEYYIRSVGVHVVIHQHRSPPYLPWNNSRTTVSFPWKRRLASRG